MLTFFAEKLWEAFALQKLLTFSAKNGSDKKFYVLYIWIFNVLFSNSIVSFAQLDPDCVKA